MCGHKGDHQRHKVLEDPWTEELMETAKFLMDDVYARICDLEEPNSIFAADLFYHTNCFPGYIFKYNTAKKESRNPIKDKGTVQGQQLAFKNYVDLTINIFNKNRGISVSDIRDMEAIFNSAY